MRTQYINSRYLSIAFKQESLYNTWLHLSMAGKKSSLGTATRTVAYGKCQLMSAKSVSPLVPSTQQTTSTLLSLRLSFFVAEYAVRQKDWIKRYWSRYSNDHRTDWNWNSSPFSSYRLFQPFLCCEKIKNVTVSSLHLKYISFLIGAQGRNSIVHIKLLSELHVCLSAQSLPLDLQRVVEDACERCCVELHLPVGSWEDFELMKPCPDSGKGNNVQSASEVSQELKDMQPTNINSLNEKLHVHNSCTISTSISISNPTYWSNFVPGFTLMTEMGEATLRVYSTNLIVAIIAKLIHYMLGWWQLLSWSS